MASEAGERAASLLAVPFISTMQSLLLALQEYLEFACAIASGTWHVQSNPR